MPKPKDREDSEPGAILTEHLAVYVTKDERDHLERLSKSQDRTVSWIVRRMIQDAMEKAR